MSNEKETWLFWVYKGLYYPFFGGILRNHYEHQDFMKSKAGFIFVAHLLWNIFIAISGKTGPVRCWEVFGQIITISPRVGHLKWIQMVV